MKNTVIISLLHVSQKIKSDNHASGKYPCTTLDNDAYMRMDYSNQECVNEGNYYSGKIRNYFGLYIYEQFLKPVSSPV